MSGLRYFHGAFRKGIKGTDSTDKIRLCVWRERERERERERRRRRERWERVERGYVNV